MAPDSSAESAPRDSRSKFFEKFESLAEYSESNGGSPQTWMPETRVSRNAWTSSVADESVRVDSLGRAFVVDSLAVEQAPVVPSTQPAAPAADVPLSDAFLLNSLPGANRTIYLDFTGLSLVGTYWPRNGTFADTSDDYTDEQMQMPAYDVDGDTATFNNLELQNIIDTWSAVAEDYAAFNVNVTTADPGAAALDRTNVSDTVYGMRALITNDTNAIASDCGCGGIAYLGVFDSYGTFKNTYYGPSLNFAQTHHNGKTISDIVSHEVGHNVGLSHDGLMRDLVTTAGYYGGRDGWAPIMGVGYYQPLVQLSNGTYTSADTVANNTEDDFAVAVSNGLALRTDDHGDARGTSSALTNGTDGSGFISTRSDVDYFSFTAVAPSHDISVTSPSLSTNLDIQAQLFDSSGTLLSTTNPDLFRVSTPIATGLDAVFTATTTPGETYYIAVDGVGFGSGTTTGYSDYGSLGEYRVLVAPLTLSAGTPTISGSGVFGTQLTGSPGTWADNPTLSTEWYRNGVATGDTDSSYSIAANDVGNQIELRVVATKVGYSRVDVNSTPVTVTAATISTQGTPTVSGTGAVGTTLTGSTGTWLDGVSFSTQWYRNGGSASDSDSSYTILPSDLGKTLVFHVVASKAGYNSVTADSASVTVIAGTISPTATPTISGTAKVKKTLTAGTRGWMSGVSVGYQWLRNGSNISSATRSTYKLAKSDRGKRISVRISVTKEGYTSVTSTSAQTKKVAG